MICSILHVLLKLNCVEEMIMNILEHFEQSIVDKYSLDELISTFEEMCEISIEEESEKMILFETGTYSKEYMCLKNIPIAKIEVYMDET